MIRNCSHAGTWYFDNASRLEKQLSDWLKVAKRLNSNVKSVIAPHAGYTYSGRTASHAYINLVPEKFKRVFILGPSHHVYMKTCGLTKLDTWETPIGNLKVDREISDTLYNTGDFVWNSKSVDEDEHSLEMQLPYIAKVAENKLSDLKIVPIMVGNLSLNLEEKYGKILAPYFDDPDNFFVISSDFCHWGERFGYTKYENQQVPIYQYIEELDKQAMSIIETGDPVQFDKYLKILKIHLWSLPNRYDISSVHYEQSSKVVQPRDSSVSYAVLAFTKLD
ncbi:hypothetical protein DICPUDRAFT_94236 [Dictyostelium purpureum]|uniref:Uncharacterized protein n=1 Tax=Dictyostelium purpureum TaxID=5786 RepID=F0ZH00_DICPU|nr:uncharacterized protein DICPUDRAFT_94236 [Dictyostelium purpureum]EGC36765.1 hypothetical protein DICPUDRAFT_94236 [Dictyostelium purpureum]|eukprot:XP_003286711.1 hypothetical protein DICPUDRAFT_94236 [Dictyostelium purpureum]